MASTNPHPTCVTEDPVPVLVDHGSRISPPQAAWPTTARSRATSASNPMPVERLCLESPSAPSSGAGALDEREPSERVWLVSNRLPYRVDSATQALARGDGGLVSALLPVHRAGNSWWVGQGGFPEEDAVQAQMREERILDVNLPADLVALHYNGASNGAIWPLFHYFPAICKFEPAEWDAYKEVNARFADAIAARCGDTDTVWVHDYQLMLLPAMLRALKPRLRIGYFHHVPFPATEVLKTHPARSELLLGLLGSDVVGFHTLEYVRNFTAAVSRVLGFDAVAEDVHVEDRIVRVGAMPLGLDTAAVFKALTTPEHAVAVEKLRSNGFGKLILGVDRLDYTKGIPEKLLAFELFLTKHPEWKGKVALVQLCVPSRVDVDTYSDLRLEIEQLVGRINGKLGWPGWVPIQYLFQTRPLPELTALYRCADVALVTPLRDGLNLVCKEYCAVHADGTGVLILSEFAGAAFEMGEALLVNPNSRTDMVDALYAALTMEEEEVHERMRVLHARVTEANNESWAAGFLAAVKDVSDRNAAFESCLLDRTSSPTTFSLAKDAIAVLDVDAASALQFRSRKATQQMLMRLIENLPASTLVTITSASAQEVSGLWFPPNAWIIAERGAAIRTPGGEWRVQPTPESLDVYRPEILRTLKLRASLVPRSRVVENSSSIYWILGHSAAAFVTPLLLETVHALNILLARSSWCCIRTGFGLAVVNTQHTIASALDYIASVTEAGAVEGTSSSVVSIGDRWSDVTLFQWRGVENQSIAVGSPVSAAKYVVPSLSELLRVLQADASLSPADLSSPLLSEGNNRNRRSGVGGLTGAGVSTPPWRPQAASGSKM